MRPKNRYLCVLLLIMLGVLISIYCAYLIGWWGGYRHGVSVNPQLFATELRILNGSLSP